MSSYGLPQPVQPATDHHLHLFSSLSFSLPFFCLVTMLQLVTISLAGTSWCCCAINLSMEYSHLLLHQ